MNLSKEARQVVQVLDKLSMTDELNILVHITNKYGLKTISNYIRDSGENRQTVYNKIHMGKMPSIDLMGITFVIEM